MKKGFYLYIGRKEYFLVSNKVNITDRLAMDFLNRIQNHLNLFTNISPAIIDITKRKIRKACLSYHTTSTGYNYIDISGDNFGGYGDENTVIFE